MKTNFKLSVKTPCTEKFENFKKTASGGFCNSCTKEVIDFTSMSDQEIIAYFNTRKENTCGKFNQTQLKTYAEYSAREKRSSHSMIAAFGLSIISILSTGNTAAQEKKPKYNVHSNAIKKNNDSLKQLVKKDTIYRGRVTDKDGTLPGVSVLIKGTTRGGETDYDGNFSVKANIGDVLVISYLGYETIEFTVSKTTRFIPVKMVESGEVLGMVIMGEVEVDKLYKSKRSLKEKVKNLF